MFLPGGTFDMGDWGSDLGPGKHYLLSDAAQPLHKVTLDGFSMQKYKVTYADFDVFTQATGRTKINTVGRISAYRAPLFPARVNWYGAKAYCAWLAKQTKLPFDLPTEAQWEYAARSGGKRVFFATDNGKLEEGRNYPNYEQRSQLGNRRGARQIPIGLFPPNPVGLYGMQEISEEWMDNWDYDYKAEPAINPRGPTTGERKMLRGISGDPYHEYVFLRMARHPAAAAVEKGVDATVYMNQDYFDYAGGDVRCVVNTSNPTR